MWPIQGKELDLTRFVSLEPLKVLNYYDGPRIFTCLDADQGLCLACWSDEDEDVARFLVVPCSEVLVSQLETGVLSVREALEQPRTWVIDIKQDGRVGSVKLVRLADVPPDALPGPGALLHQALEPFLRVRAIGDLIRPGEVPGSVIRFTVEGTQKAIKALAEHELALQPPGGGSLRALKRLYDLPTRALRAASFEVTFGSPFSEPDLFAGMSEQEVRTERTILAKVGDHLRSGLDWLTADTANRSLPVPEDPTLSRVILRAIRHLTPPSQGAIRVIELRGELVRRTASPARLTRNARGIVNAALKQFPPPKERRVRLVGLVRELDADTYQFELREIEGGPPTRRCVFDPELWDDVHDLLGEDARVEVLGIERGPANPIEVIDLGRVSEQT